MYAPLKLTGYRTATPELERDVLCDFPPEIPCDLDSLMDFFRERLTCSALNRTSAVERQVLR
jgi:hypothetical protein